MSRLLPLALLLCALPASAVTSVVEWRFDNGMKVLVLEDHKLPTVHISVLFKGAGALTEPTTKAGLAVLTADLMREGTSTMSAKELAEKIDFLGASLWAGADWDSMSVTARGLSRDTETLLGLLADVVQRPAFKQEELDRAKSRMIAAIIQSLDDADSLAPRAFQRFLYGSHRFGLPLNGIERTVKPLTRDDVVAHHAANLRADNAVMVVSGDVDVKKLQEQLARVFATFKPGSPSTSAPPPETFPRDVKILLLDKPDLTQAKITFGHVGIPREHPDYYAAAVMNGVLGGSGFLSRLTQTVRSKMGLTYSIRSGFDARKTGGPWTITSFTRTDQAVDAIRATIAEIERLQSGAVPAKELQDVESFLVGQFQLAMETPDARANALLYADLFNLGLDYVDTHPLRIRAVTTKDVARAAQSLLNPSILRIVVVGNAAQLQDALSTIGSVEVRPHTKWADDGLP